jgi:GNAT superfamily N-acetyltransferase
MDNKGLAMSDSPNDSLANLARKIQPMMSAYPALWGVAGGWAIDHFLGRMTRTHADVEIAIFRRDQLLLQKHLHAWRFDKIVEGRRKPWDTGEFLELPVHEIHGRSKTDPSESIEILLNQRDDANWIFRRNAAVTLPLDRAIVQADCGLPSLAPEIVLLYKSKSPREKDEADFLATRDALEPARRRWLGEALRLCDPGHRWLKSLDPIVVRPAEAADAESIVNIHFHSVRQTAGAYYPDHVLAAWSSPPDRARVHRVALGIRDGQEMVVAELEGIVCGFGSIVPGDGQLRAVYVDPKFGRRGVGSAILRRLEELAVRSGLGRLSMDASLNAEAFYRKHDYSVVGRGFHRLASGVEMECVKMTKVIA